MKIEIHLPDAKAVSAEKLPAGSFAIVDTSTLDSEVKKGDLAYIGANGDIFYIRVKGWDNPKHCCKAFIPLPENTIIEITT